MLPWLVAVAAAAGFGLLIAFGSSWGAFVLMTILAALGFTAIGSTMRTETDHKWLVKFVILGFLAKLAGTLARFYMVVVLYGAGDSYRYFRVGSELATQFRNGRLPELVEASQGAFGTQMLELITGGIFAIYTPDMLGGFLIFSLFSFGGQLMFYAAFRNWAETHQLKPYAFLILFLPTYAFWPSSIGKDALVIFALGGAAFFISRVLEGFETRWLLGLAPFLALLGFIRIHVAGLIVVALIGAGLVARMPPNAGAGAALRRLLILGSFIAAGALVLTIFPDFFGVDITGTDSLDSFTADVVRRTSESGTVASGGPVSGPTDIPKAIALVLFRPYAFEATELQHLLAAAETTLILGLTIWKLPALLRNWRSWRSNGYVVFSTIYVLGFSIAFSVVRNLGIIARQRGQVLALYLVLIIGLGWQEAKENSPSPRYVTVDPPPSSLRADRPISDQAQAH